MGPFQISGWPFREPRVSEIAHSDSWPVQDLQCAVSDPQCPRRALPFAAQPLWQGILLDPLTGFLRGWHSCTDQYIIWMYMYVYICTVVPNFKGFMMLCELIWFCRILDRCIVLTFGSVLPSTHMDRSCVYGSNLGYQWTHNNSQNVCIKPSQTGVYEILAYTQ